ncbi:putative reverse transcriptase domain-containing protein, partial [Tanacetum coccineum]
MCELNTKYNWERIQGNGRDDGSGGQVGGQGSEMNGGVDGVLNFSTIIAQQLQNLLPTIVAQVGNQGRGQGNGRNQNDNAVNDNICGDVENATGSNDSMGCTYKEFLAFNPKEYDGKGGAIVYTRWIEKMESVQDMSGCRDSQKVKYTASLFVGKALMWWNFEILTRGREATVEPSKDRNGRDDNKRTRTRNAFATTANPVRGGYTGTAPMNCRVVPRNVNPINARNPVARTCYECGSTDHIKAVCPRLNQAQRPWGNHQNQVVAVNEGQGRKNQGNQARGRAFMLGAEEARPNPNIVTGTFTLNDHYATILFDSGTDYSFVSTNFIPLLDIEPIDLGFSYEIKIGSVQLVEINKVINGCKLEIEGHMFDINLIPFGSGSFDVIIGMDWLLDHKAEIIFHEKVVRIRLLDGKVLRVLREKPKEKMRKLMSAKAKEKKQEEIVVVRDFPEVFPRDDLSGLPTVREIEFRIELIPEATPVANSPYRFAPSELEELSGQLKELQ